MVRKASLQVVVPALLALIAWNTYLAVNHLRRVQKISALTLESSTVQAEVSAVLKDMTDMETGQRGFLLTGNAAYLQPYIDAKARIGADLVSLRAGLSNRTKSEQSLQTRVESLTTSKQAEMERSINLRQQGYRHRSLKLVNTDEGKSYMDEIRRIASSLSSSESGNFATLNNEETAALKRAFFAIVVSNFILLVVAICAFALSRHYGRRLGEEVAQSRNELTVRNLQLEKLTAALSGRARSNMVALNLNSRLLLENYGGFLPRQGHEYAEQMKEAATEMELLRQDLVGSRGSDFEASDSGVRETAMSI
jgi:CHASE3 domain sensor protein